MADPKVFTYDHREIARLLVKECGVRSGHWGIFIKFRIKAANVAEKEGGDLSPAALSIIEEIGIQQFDEPNNLTVDAAKVNRRTPTKRKPKSQVRVKTVAKRKRGGK